MNDPQGRLEAELAQMRPRAASVELIEAIGNRIGGGEARPWADRFLLSAIGAGAAAACVIVAVLVGEGSRDRTDVEPQLLVQATTSDAPRFGDYPLAFARAPDVPGVSTPR